MTTYSSYKPFLIGQGKNQTGLFQYYESWITPEDAFQDIQDAYVNRGDIIKRDGTTLLGNMAYCNSQILAFGDGATKNFAGSITSNTPTGGHLPIIAGTFTVRAREALAPDATETFTDNGAGVLTGDELSTGTIDYVTGAWTLNFNTAPKAVLPIMVDYGYINKTATNSNVNEYIVGTTTNSAGPFSGTSTKNIPATAGTAYVAFNKTGSGYTAYFDDGAGKLWTAPNGAGTNVGTINYTAASFTFTMPAGTAVNGSNLVFGYAGPTTSETIMGINQWENEANGTFKLTVQDTRRMSVYNATKKAFDPVCDVNETLFIIPNLTTFNYTNFTAATATNQQVNPTFTNITPLSVVLTLVNNLTGHIEDTQSDDGAGTLVASTIFDSGSINYTTGVFVVNLKNPATFTAGWAINATFTLQNDYFSGDQSNFFNWTNWDLNTNLVPIAVDKAQFQYGFLYLTNNVDPITLFNGTYISRPAFALQQAVIGLGKNQIVRCLDVKVFSQRLLIFRPTTTIGNGNPDAQDVRWSAQLQPTNTVTDIPGSGGDATLPTYGFIQSAKFLKDYIIIHCQRDTFNFRFTGSAFAPFQVYKLNNVKTCDAPYGSIEYDDQVTSMGVKGLCTTDGNSLERYDLKIFDQYQQINAESFNQCYGARFDVLNQSWMLYPQMETNSSLSDKVLVWNYIEDSWSVYNLPLSVIYGTSLDEISDTTWQDLTQTWETADFSWTNYLLQKKSLVFLGGDFSGNVLYLNKGPTDLGTEISMSLTTKKYNPFIGELSVKCSFGYLDVYYTVNPAVFLTFEFFLDNATSADFPLFDRTIQLTGENNQNYSWQRIYINVQSQFLSWKITDNGVTGFKILGQILWASPAGRLTP